MRTVIIRTVEVLIAVMIAAAAIIAAEKLTFGVMQETAEPVAEHIDEPTDIPAPEPEAAPSDMETGDAELNGATPCEELAVLLESAGCSVEDIPGAQLVIVKSSGTTAELYTFERDADMTWQSAQKTAAGWVGKNGVTGDKTEGDKKTPAGLYLLGPAFGINSKPATKMEYRPVTEDSYWVDDPNSAAYNTWVEGTEQKDWNSAEHLSDYSPQYHYGVVINYNTSPIVPGAGSAIFLHCGSGGTSGCVALPEGDVLSLLEWLDVEKTPAILIF